MRQSLRADVWDASGGVCFHCGKPLHPFRDFHVDHVVPVVAGGSDEIENLVGSCAACNLSKNCKPYIRQRRVFVLSDRLDGDPIPIGPLDYRKRRQPAPVVD